MEINTENQIPPQPENIIYSAPVVTPLENETQPQPQTPSTVFSKILKKPINPYNILFSILGHIVYFYNTTLPDPDNAFTLAIYAFVLWIILLIIQKLSNKRLNFSFILYFLYGYFIVCFIIVGTCMMMFSGM